MRMLALPLVALLFLTSTTLSADEYILRPRGSNDRMTFTTALVVRLVLAIPFR